MPEKYAHQFTRLRVELKGARAGFDAHIAVWSNHGRGEVVIGAPTIEKLAEHWKRVTATELDRARAQHVIMIECSVPNELWQQAKEAAAPAASVDESSPGVADEA